jgi:probable F420-dependent oxidoreductase
MSSSTSVDPVQLGAIFPQTDIQGDVGAVRAYVQGVEELGYRHLVAFDHVLGADPAVHHGWDGPYDVDSTFHEPLVLFGFVAGISSLELVSGVIVAPQRQTALLAKQAAEVNLLSGGRLRLGVGLGWNEVEYEALGQAFTSRGARLEEQVALMRRLWTERSVSHSGRHDVVVGAGIAPRPSEPIPVWFGGKAPAALRRAGALGDGWFPMVMPGPELESAQAEVARGALAAGREPGGLGLEGRVGWERDDTAMHRSAEAWRAAGATHLAVNTLRRGLSSVDEHLGALAQAAQAV